MSDNVDIVREIYRRFDAGDTPGILELWDPPTDCQACMGLTLDDIPVAGKRQGNCLMAVTPRRRGAVRRLARAMKLPFADKPEFSVRPRAPKRCPVDDRNYSQRCCAAPRVRPISWAGTL